MRVPDRRPAPSTRLAAWCRASGSQCPPPPPEGTLGYVTCALAANSTKRRKKMGSSVAYKTIGTFLSQNKRHEDARGWATEMQSSGFAAVRLWPTLCFTHWTCKFDLSPPPPPPVSRASRAPTPGGGGGGWPGPREGGCRPGAPSRWCANGPLYALPHRPVPTRFAGRGPLAPPPVRCLPPPPFGLRSRGRGNDRGTGSGTRALGHTDATTAATPLPPPPPLSGRPLYN